MSRRKLTPHQRIMRNAALRKGMRLTPNDVLDLARDGAIEACALNDDEMDEELRRAPTAPLEER